jgi:hypothetical protein
MEDDSKYCPLCGAHEFEWHEGEADKETTSEFKKEIEELYGKMKEGWLAEEER